MKIPPQGFRHAVDLLLARHAREQSIHPDVIARDMMALGVDMHASPEYRDWVAAEIERRLGVRPAGALEGFGDAAADSHRRDVFLVYVPEDRLPLAAPLAVELTKRRISVAFSGFEAASQQELNAAIDRGLTLHREGAVFVTPEFTRRQFQPPASSSRLRVLDGSSSAVRIAESWAAHLQSTGDGAIQAHD